MASPLMCGGHIAPGGRGPPVYRNGPHLRRDLKIRKFKNVQASSAHYLRLGAPLMASQKISALVHKTSPGISAEPDLSRTPLKNCFEQGGRDKEDGALKSEEPTLPSQSVAQSSASLSPVDFGPEILHMDF